jgi:endonuclease G, mitochondrial
MKTLAQFSKLLVVITFVLVGYNLSAQEVETKISSIEDQIESNKQTQDSLYSVLEVLKLEKIHEDILETGLPKLEPTDTLIEHKAFCFVYDEKHEQAKWVAHIISIDVLNGRFGRSNDFRTDSLVKTGSAEEADYFTKILQPDGSYDYDGYGYDRGHLAPSADFRWSQIALSESYFYSNMSPQRPKFNRDGWADLEDLMRAYVFEKKQSIYVVTGPVLHDSLRIIKRSVNKVSIPEFYYKIVYDAENQKGIAFLMPNELLTLPIISYVKTIDEIEKITGIDFFASLPINVQKDIESQKETDWWLPARQKGDVAPMESKDLPKNSFNTVQAKHFIDNGDKVKICGTVVSTYKSQKGNVFINLDKQYPNQIFSISIFSSSMINFTYEPEKYLKGKTICVKGKVSEYRGIPSMIIENQRHIEIIDE